jgi:hypothetical protein
MTDAASDRPDVLELLEADHHRIRHLLAEGAPDAELIRELTVHIVTEAHLVYPEARHNVADIDRTVDDLLDVDHLLEEALLDLEIGGGDDVRKRVRELGVRHCDHQEDLLFPRLRSDIERDHLVDLGDALGEAMAGAPTHPHPNLPDEGLRSSYADAIAAIIDDWRDARRRRREQG